MRAQAHANRCLLAVSSAVNVTAPAAAHTVTVITDSSQDDRIEVAALQSPRQRQSHPEIINVEDSPPPPVARKRASRPVSPSKIEHFFKKSSSKQSSAAPRAD
jgi:hypothetical protein